ncbi:lactate/malate family dehydrogenase [Paludisphaera mucosa]|uniref:NAD(P)-binding domain-containing protein n=1 Tax=Paludisphaera mucosa TaxID=3030827 RepID=A0ABT6FAT0_9BACT|nr:NAD(P)-binding domain-containing protein [Paludisphaera mucosa]MDG3004656.1 NAD(P)-binding domain-containing protein [Paludisphaera mucosa]
MKISVVGMGRVGGATAFALVARGIPHELVLVGRTKERTVGDAFDLLHASALVRPMRVVAGDAADTAASDVVILAVSAAADDVAGGRAAHAEANARLLREIVPPLAEASPSAVFLVMTNPVDVCTYVTLKASGLPPGRVLGTGTLLDTMRFRSLLSRETGINAQDVRAYILGEHGETQFPALSVASAGGVRFEPRDSTVRAFAEEARQGGHLVARSKGYTNYAVALAATSICEAVADDARTVLPVSTLVDGYKGLGDVCLSLPCVVGRQGVERILAIDLDDDETALLHQSAAAIRAGIDRVEAAGLNPSARG